MYDIGLPSGRTLFHLHCHRVQRVRVLASRQSARPIEQVRCSRAVATSVLTTVVVCGCKIHAPLLVMTSDATYDDTVNFFKQCDYL